VRAQELAEDRGDRHLPHARFRLRRDRTANRVPAALDADRVLRDYRSALSRYVYDDLGAMGLDQVTADHCQALVDRRVMHRSKLGDCRLIHT
jgi:hypothetical protein